MFQNKIIVNLALLLAFTGAAVGSVTLWKITTQSESFLSTTSPKGTYTVRLTDRKDRPKIPLLNHKVLFSVTRDGKVVLANRYLHSGDWFDPSFDLLCPDYTWETDEVLHFYKKEFSTEAPPEKIIVLNKTREMIQYLRVTSVDTFLLFRRAARICDNSDCFPPRGDFAWINVEGEFQGGRPIKGSGVIMRSSLSSHTAQL